MAYCSKCGADIKGADRFCRECGASTAPAKPTTPTTTAPKKRSRAALVGAFVALAGVGLAFPLLGKGCADVEGTLTATGDSPLGELSFTPTDCRSGQRGGFYGAVLLGDGPTEGGVLVIDDVTRGKLLKVEIPGSCEPPDYEECTVVEISPEQCEQFDMKVRNTNVIVNEIRAVEGHLNVQCRFPEGGELAGSLTFTGCH